MSKYSNSKLGLPLLRIGQLVLVVCVAMIAVYSSQAQLQTVYEQEWADGQLSGWHGGEIVSQDRRSRPIHFSQKVENAYGLASGPEDAMSPTFTPSVDGSFRLTFVFFANNVNAFGTNYGWIDLLNSETQEYWRISLRNFKDDPRHVTVRRNGDPAAGPEQFQASINWSDHEMDGVGDLMKCVFERDDATNLVKVYLTHDIDSEVTPADLLITLGNGSDMSGLNQLRIHDALNDHNRRVYVKVKVESVPAEIEPM